MLAWAVILLVVSLIAGMLGFTDIAKGAAKISRVLFFICLVIFLLVALALAGIF